MLTASGLKRFIFILIIFDSFLTPKSLARGPVKRSKGGPGPYIILVTDPPPPTTSAARTVGWLQTAVHLLPRSAAPADDQPHAMTGDVQKTGTVRRAMRAPHAYMELHIGVLLAPCERVAKCTFCADPHGACACPLQAILGKQRCSSP